MVGQEKIAVLIAEKGQNLILQLVPTISEIATKVGIENIGTPDVKYPNTCLSPNEIQKILNIRNNLLSKLNSTARSIESLSKIIRPLSTVVTVTSTALNTVSTSRTVANIAMAAVPTALPGAAPAAINSLKDLEEFLSPKITIAQNIITSVSTALDFVSFILFNLINLLKSIDKYLTGCGVASSDLAPLSDYLTNVETTVSQTIANQNQPASTVNTLYNGFILEIVDVPFSPTVKQIKAVAKNNQGIILLQTPPSFTTIPQVLIEELKLIIDSSNLKAY